MYPANTNILYVGLKQTAAQIRKGFVKGGGAVLPGMIFNLNKKVTYTDAVTGLERSIRAGRMECTMQVSGWASAPGITPEALTWLSRLLLTAAPTPSVAPEPRRLLPYSPGHCAWEPRGRLPCPRHVPGLQPAAPHNFLR